MVGSAFKVNEEEEESAFFDLCGTDLSLMDGPPWTPLPPLILGSSKPPIEARFRLLSSPDWRLSVSPEKRHVFLLSHQAVKKNPVESDYFEIPRLKSWTADARCVWGFPDFLPSAISPSWIFWKTFLYQTNANLDIYPSWSYTHHVLPIRRNSHLDWYPSQFCPSIGGVLPIRFLPIIR